MSMERDGKYLKYHGLLCPKETHSEDSLKYFENFNTRDDDVIAITYPKSGTIWMQEILPLILSGGNLTAVHTVPNWDRVPWMEETRAPLVLDSKPSPRAMVSHMPYHLMPASFFSSQAKVIYVARNPKDVLVSSFYFHQMASFLDDPGTFEQFLDKFLAGEVLFGKWTDHVKSWRQNNLGDRILFVTYEEMVKDLRGALKRLLCFLGREMSEESLEQVVSHCTFNQMKTNTMSNFSLIPRNIMDHQRSPFLRKGVTGDWKNHLSPDQEEKFNDVIKEEMAGVDTQFPWDEE
ncbi:sulfotransferase 2B1-like [Engraulis encrasicolus]|uniref:sulfotransferase 2B1-like n=1 Tax=Engraulis encrasicolus TaxID=184585 RepID=UPI002FD1EFAF